MSTRTLIDNYIEGRETPNRATPVAETLSELWEACECPDYSGSCDACVAYYELSAQVREAAADMESEGEFEERANGVSRDGDE
jgi:hypothetical protein